MSTIGNNLRSRISRYNSILLRVGAVLLGVGMLFFFFPIAARLAMIAGIAIAIASLFPSSPGKKKTAKS